ncbi:MAG TPA: hypothetical protein VF020_19585, partial [Chthoniobacterales bacterium]
RATSPITSFHGFCRRDLGILGHLSSFDGAFNPGVQEEEPEFRSRETQGTVCARFTKITAFF